MYNYQCRIYKSAIIPNTIIIIFRIPGILCTCFFQLVCSPFGCNIPLRTGRSFVSNYKLTAFFIFDRISKAVRNRRLKVIHILFFLFDIFKNLFIRNTEASVRPVIRPSHMPEAPILKVKAKTYPAGSPTTQ